MWPLLQANPFIARKASNSYVKWGRVKLATFSLSCTLS